MHVLDDLLVDREFTRSTRDIDPRRRSDAPRASTSPEMSKTCGLVPHGKKNNNLPLYKVRRIKAFEILSP